MYPPSYKHALVDSLSYLASFGRFYFKMEGNEVSVGNPEDIANREKTEPTVDTEETDKGNVKKDAGKKKGIFFAINQRGVFRSGC